jgi:hypothetical protein
MNFTNLPVAVVAGIGLSVGGAIPVAQAVAPAVHHSATSAYSAQALNALGARWNAEAAAYRAAQARLESARALQALGARWNAEAAAYRAAQARLESARALKALGERWNAEAGYFGVK